MNIQYSFNPNEYEIVQSNNEKDFDFIIRLKNAETGLASLRKVRDHYNRDNIYTDVMFYAHSDHEYRFIVREDSYVSFLLVLFKYRLLLKMEWAN